MSTSLKEDVIKAVAESKSTSMGEDMVIAYSNKTNWMERGWECPKCGAVMSPTTSVCVNCRGNHHNISNEKDLQEEVKKYLGEYYDYIHTGDYPEAHYVTTSTSSGETYLYNKHDEAHIGEKDIGTMKGIVVNLV